MKIFEYCQLSEWLRLISSLFQLFATITTDSYFSFYDQLGRRNYVTPTSYLEFILTYKTLYVKKRDELTNKRQRFLDGLDKLAAAAALIVIMQGELTILKKELSAMAEETEKLMVKIEAETVEAEAAKEIIAAEEIIAQESAAVAQVIKEDCETDLAEALPALEAGEKTFRKINNL